MVISNLTTSLFATRGSYTILPLLLVCYHFMSLFSSISNNHAIFSLILSVQMFSSENTENTEYTFSSPQIQYFRHTFSSENTENTLYHLNMNWISDTLSVCCTNLNWTLHKYSYVQISAQLGNLYIVELCLAGKISFSLGLPR